MNLIFLISFIFFNNFFSAEKKEISYKNLMLCCLEVISNSEHFKRKISNNDCCNTKLDFYKKFYTKHDITKLPDSYSIFLYNINRAIYLYEKSLIQKFKQCRFKIYLGPDNFSKITLSNDEIKERFSLCKKILSGEAKKLIELSEEKSFCLLDELLKKKKEYFYLKEEIEKIKEKEFFIFKINEIYEKESYKKKESQFFEDQFFEINENNRKDFIESINKFYQESLISKISDMQNVIDCVLYLKYRYGLEEISLNQ